MTNAPLQNDPSDKRASSACDGEIFGFSTIVPREGTSLPRVRVADVNDLVSRPRFHSPRYLASRIRREGEEEKEEKKERERRFNSQSQISIKSTAHRTSAFVFANNLLLISFQIDYTEKNILFLEESS